MNFWDFSSLQWLRIVVLWPLLYMSSGEHMYAFLIGWDILVDRPQFTQVTMPTSSVWGFQPLHILDNTRHCQFFSLWQSGGYVVVLYYNFVTLLWWLIKLSTLPYLLVICEVCVEVIWPLFNWFIILFMPDANRLWETCTVLYFDPVACFFVSLGPYESLNF